MGGGGGGGGVDGGDEVGVVAGGWVVGLEGGDAGDREIAVLAVEDAIFGGGGAVDVVSGVGRVGHEGGGEVFWEEDLADVGGVAGGVGVGGGGLAGDVSLVAAEADFEVDVVGAALVEAGKDGLEGGAAFPVGDLDAAAEGEVVGGLVEGWWAEAFGWAGVVAGVFGVEAGGWATGATAWTAGAAGATWATGPPPGPPGPMGFCLVYPE